VAGLRMEDLGAALARLDDSSRALLDLSLRRAQSDAAIAEVLRVDRDEVARRRGELLDRIASEVGAGDRAEREELRASLPDLPAEYWSR
jgi:hypothetical protein